MPGFDVLGEVNCQAMVLRDLLVDFREILIKEMNRRI
jgi:hypothetical protein